MAKNIDSPFDGAGGLTPIIVFWRREGANLALAASAEGSDNKRTMPLDWENGALAEGLACYRRQEFFEAHEHWESVWLRTAEPDKTLLQALIQITVAFHHLQKKNTAGAVGMLDGALRRLDGFPDEYGGLAIESLRASVRAWRAALEWEPPLRGLPFPQIR